MGEERNANQLLHKELETLRAEFEALAARNKLESDVEIMRRASTSVDRIRSPRASQGMINIDLTTYPSRASTQTSRVSEQIRLKPGTHNRIVEDVFSTRRSSGYGVPQRPLQRVSSNSPRFSTTSPRVSPRVSTTFVEIDQASMSS